VAELTTVWYDGGNPAPGAAGRGLAGERRPETAVAPGHAPELLAGAMLGGRYRLGRPLGSGGFARVYDAFDCCLRRWVAVKVYEGKRAGQLSLDEARLQAVSQHPNLMPLYDSGSDPLLGVTFIVMPLYPGADLAATLDRYGPMPYRPALLCADQVCSALEFLWQKQAVHGDVKPANIWLTHSGAALLMDFNVHGLLARGAGTRAGTPGYTAPEARAGRMDPRSDVFSLGCVLYQCLAGIPPFADDRAVQAGRFVPLSRLRVDIRPELEAVVHTALAPDPEARYQSAREFRTALRHPAGTVGGGSMSGRVDGETRGGDGTATRRRVMPQSRSGRRGSGEVRRRRNSALSGPMSWPVLLRQAGRLHRGAWKGVWQVLRYAFRHPLQALVEGVLLWFAGRWLLQATLGWLGAHRSEVSLAAVLLLLLAAGMIWARWKR
jgi:protein kinase-like protein